MTHVARELGISIDRVFDWVVQACHDPRQLHEGTLSETVQAELAPPCGLTTASACARSRLCVTPSASSSARPPPTDGAGGDRDARYWRPGRPGGSPHGTAVRGRHPLGVMLAGCHPLPSHGCLPVGVLRMEGPPPAPHGRKPAPAGPGRVGHAHPGLPCPQPGHLRQSPHSCRPRRARHALQPAWRRPATRGVAAPRRAGPRSGPSCLPVGGISRTNHVWVADTAAIRTGEGGCISPSSSNCDQAGPSAGRRPPPWMPR